MNRFILFSRCGVFCASTSVSVAASNSAQKRNGNGIVLNFIPNIGFIALTTYMAPVLCYVGLLEYCNRKTSEYFNVQ